jgi:hypothetical protein
MSIPVPTLDVCTLSNIRVVLTVRKVQAKNYLDRPSAFIGIVDGARKQVADEQGCGATRVLKLFVFARAPNDVSAVPLLAGTTHADPILQKDAIQFVVRAAATVAAGVDPGCQNEYIADTEFVEQENVTLAGVKGPSWRELWTLISCTREMQIPGHFIPDAPGTSIIAGPNTAINRIPLAGSSQ